MNTYKNSKTILINSLDRIEGTDSNFLFKVDDIQTKGFNRCCVIQALIPRSYYMVSDINNSFTVSENGTPYTITITNGSYSMKALRTTLITALNAALVYTYTVSYPSVNTVDTGKFTYSVSGNSDIQPIFIFTENSARELLGFPVGSHPFVADSLTSEYVLKLQKEDSLKVHSNTIIDNVLCHVFVSDDPTYTNSIYRCIDVQAQAKKLNSTTTNVMNIYITDEYDNEIDMNGHNIIIEMLFWMEDTLLVDTLERLNNFIKYIGLQLPPINESKQEEQ